MKSLFKINFQTLILLMLIFSINASENSNITINYPNGNEIETPQTISKVPIPEGLFDISFELNTQKYSKNDKLEGIIIFENFGTNPTNVNFTIAVYNQNSAIISLNKFSKTVETNQVYIETFEDLKKINLTSGVYTVVLETKYGKNIHDKFVQQFTVSDKIPSFKLFNNLLYLLLILIFASLYLIYKYQYSNQQLFKINKKSKTSTIKKQIKKINISNSNSDLKQKLKKNYETPKSKIKKSKYSTNEIYNKVHKLNKK